MHHFKFQKTCHLNIKYHCILNKVRLLFLDLLCTHLFLDCKLEINNNWSLPSAEALTVEKQRENEGKEKNIGEIEKLGAQGRRVEGDGGEPGSKGGGKSTRGGEKRGLEMGYPWGAGAGRNRK